VVIPARRMPSVNCPKKETGNERANALTKFHNVRLTNVCRWRESLHQAKPPCRFESGSVVGSTRQRKDNKEERATSVSVTLATKADGALLRGGPSARSLVRRRVPEQCSGAGLWVERRSRFAAGASPPRRTAISPNTQMVGRAPLYRAWTRL
jgi:hypothetical protein